VTQAPGQFRQQPVYGKEESRQQEYARDSDRIREILAEEEGQEDRHREEQYPDGPRDQRRSDPQRTGRHLPGLGGTSGGCDPRKRDGADALGDESRKVAEGDRSHVQTERPAVHQQADHQLIDPHVVDRRNTADYSPEPEAQDIRGGCSGNLAG